MITRFGCCLFVLLLLGCDPPDPQPQEIGIRIASLSPALTMTLIQIGIGDKIVARSAFCRNVDALPVVGDLQHIDAEQLVRVRPTHVCTQRRADSIDPKLLELAHKHGWTVISQPLIGLGDVDDLLATLPEQFPQKRVIERCSELRAALRRALQPADIAQRPRVLIVGGGDTPLAWGAETYLGELVAAAGGDNLISGRVWRSCSLEEIARYSPDLVIVPSESDSIDISGLVAAVGEERIRPLVFKDIKIPGPHLALLAEPLRGFLITHSAYSEAP